jgi:hypothetical protein
MVVHVLVYAINPFLFSFSVALVIKIYRLCARGPLPTTVSISNCLDDVYYTINEARDGWDLRHKGLAGPLCGSLTLAVLHSDIPSQSQSCNTVSKTADERRKPSNIGLTKNSDLEDDDGAMFTASSRKLQAEHACCN